MTPQDVVAGALGAGLTVATAESLTAGSVSAALAEVPGASGMLRGGVVAYANEVKRDVLGVSGALLEEKGSVDAAVAAGMAEGVRALMGADIGVSTTGVAGPDAHDGQPVGTVFVAAATAGGTVVRQFSFGGDRAEVRVQARTAALALLGQALHRGTKAPTH